MAGVDVSANGKEIHDLRLLLAGDERDFLTRNNGDQVKINNLDGKTIGLYFSASWCGPCRNFTPKLVEAYNEIASKGNEFEVVFITSDKDEDSFHAYFSKMPWLAIPFGDRSCEKLLRYFEIRSIPTLAVIGPDGKTLVTNAADLVEEHGIEAFPFSPEKLEELVEKEKVKLESQTLESLLVSGKLDYVMGNGGNKVSVAELVGKNILLYFSAQWCGPCRAFLPKLIELYHKIKKMDNAFEIIFISSDREEKSYEDFFASMPWLALPFGDERKKFLSQRFKIRGIPSLVAIGSTGRTVTDDAKKLLVIHGADAYPFNEEKIRELEARVEEMAMAWPKKANHQFHEAHELILTRHNSYGCDGCGELGYGWAYQCSDCNFDLHPMCALKEEKDGLEAEEKEGYVCDGDVCRRV